MLVDQYVIPRTERAGQLFQYRTQASCSCTADVLLTLYRYVFLFTNWEALNTSLHSATVRNCSRIARAATVRFTHCEKPLWKNESSNSSVHSSMRVRVFSVSFWRSLRVCSPGFLELKDWILNLDCQSSHWMLESLDGERLLLRSLKGSTFHAERWIWQSLLGWLADFIVEIYISTPSRVT